MIGPIEPADVSRLLKGAQRSGVAAQGEPLLIAVLGKPAILWANAAAEMTLGATDLKTLGRIVFGTSPDRALLARLQRLRPGTPDQLERLSLASGFKVERLTLICRAVEDAALGPALVVQIVGAGVARVAPDQPQPDEPAAEAVAVPVPVEHDESPTEAVAAPTPVEDDEPPAEAVAAPAAVAEDEPAPAPDDSAPVAAPAPMVQSVAAVEAAFAGRLAGGRAPRFVWESDADGIIQRVAPALADVVGATAPAVGDDLPGLLEAYAPAGAAIVRDAFANHASWSGVSVPWPVERSEAAVAITLGGAPLPGARAYRGFGVIHLDQVSARPIAPEAIAPEPAPVTEFDDQEATGLADQEANAPGGDASRDPFAPDEPAVEAVEAAPAAREPAPLPPTAVRDPEAQPSEPSKVVHLMRFKAAAQSGPGQMATQRPTGWTARPEANDDEAPVPIAAPHWSESPPDDVPPAEAQSRLSTLEQSAFQEIARTLNARDEAGDPPKAAAEPGIERAAPAPAKGGAAEPAAAVAAPSGSALLDHLPAAVLIVQAERPAYANRALLDLVGFDRLDDFRAAGGLNPPAALPMPGALRIGLATAQGRVAAADATTQIIVWNGAPATMMVVRRPVDEEAAARIEAIRLDLQRSQALAQDLAEALDVAAAATGFLDPAGRILSITAAAEQFFGYDQKEVVGDTPGLFLAPGQHMAWTTFLAPYTSSTPPTAVAQRQFEGRARHGETLRLAVSLKPLGHGRTCIVWQDAALDAGAAGSEIENARREAERASAMKSEFLAKVSHEIRTPLNAILGFAEIMIDERFGPVGNERYKEYLKDIHSSGTHVMSLVNDLLDISRIEAGRLDLKLVAIDANAVVNECVTTLQTQAHRERVILRLSLAQRLPSVLADERALRQIVLNLLSNAVKFNEPGGQVIVSTAVAENGAVAIRIRDTGLGMSEKDIEIAMEPFRQLETPKASAGSGLGLPLTKALVEASHASMVIKSRPREGTLVEVVFQQAPAEAVSVPAE